jgi:hypothetical protein
MSEAKVVYQGETPCPADGLSSTATVPKSVASH